MSRIFVKNHHCYLQDLKICFGHSRHLIRCVIGQISKNKVLLVYLNVVFKIVVECTHFEIFYLTQSTMIISMNEFWCRHIFYLSLFIVKDPSYSGPELISTYSLLNPKPKKLLIGFEYSDKWVKVQEHAIEVRRMYEKIPSRLSHPSVSPWSLCLLYIPNLGQILFMTTQCVLNSLPREKSRRKALQKKTEPSLQCGL